MGFVVAKGAIWHVFLHILWASLVGNFPTIFRTHISFIYHWYFTILTKDSIVNKTFLSPPPIPLTNPTSIALELNTGFHSGTPVNNHLSYGTIMVMYVTPLLHAKSFHSITLLNGLNTMQWLIHMNNILHSILRYTRNLHDLPTDGGQ